MTDEPVNHRHCHSTAYGSIEPRLQLGRVVATYGALRKMLAIGIDPKTLLTRHATGDWSEMDAEDRKANIDAAATGLRVFSAYRISESERIWIITEADRSVTTFLLPHEY
jgi:hypothetical protein